jgi:hypothetical protein
MAAAASDRPVSRLLNRSANFGGIGKPGTLSRDTTAQKALPKGKQQSAKSMGRSTRALRSKPLAAGVRGKPAPVQRTRRAALVQKRAVPTVSTVNHSGDYGL